MYWYDAVGMIGVGLAVVAYVFQQLERMDADDYGYLILNAVGAGLILLSLLFTFNLSAFLMESFWLAISLLGLARRRRAETRLPPPAP
jgi:hypothetical protein